MIEIDIPGRGLLRLSHAVLDVNGTIAVDGHLIDGMPERLSTLRQRLTIHLLTADTHGGQADIDTQLGLTAHRLLPGGERLQKAEYVHRLGASSVVAIGNGGNDVGMLKTAALSIAVIGREGVSAEAIAAADVIVVGAADAFDLLLNTRRLIATLRQ